MSLLKNTSFLVLCLSFIAKIDNAKILGMFFVPSISHQVIYQPIWKELSLRGHKVTVISPNILNDSSLTNLTEIDVGFSYKIMKKSNLQINMAKENYLISNLLFGHDLMLSLLESQLESKEVQDLIQSDDDFDLVLVEGLHPLVFAFGARFKAPVIDEWVICFVVFVSETSDLLGLLVKRPPDVSDKETISSVEVFTHIHDIFANPTHPVLNPDLLVNFHEEPTFADRLSSFVFNIVSRICYYGWILPRSDKAARQFFGNDLPYLGDIVRNTTLMLINTNPIMHAPRPNVPSVIEIEQMHIKAKTPLPKDLQEYMDSSTRGVVYFSLGSNINSVNLSEERRETIKHALAELPYNVIWKWEEDHLPGKPDNVLIRKWLPQQDILGHPNLKVFITQGGIQSIEEAIFNRVPMIGIPFFVDQPKNVKVLVEKGMAIRLDPKTMTKDELRRAILEVATNPRFREQLQKAKDVLLDQPMTGLNKAIWWIEYILRHKEVRHLRSPAADMSFFQYFMVDVVGFVLISLCIAVYSLIRVLRLSVNSGSRKSKTD